MVVVVLGGSKAVHGSGEYAKVCLWRVASGICTFLILVHPTFKVLETSESPGDALSLVLQHLGLLKLLGNPPSAESWVEYPTPWVLPVPSSGHKSEIKYSHTDLEHVIVNSVHCPPACPSRGSDFSCHHPMVGKERLCGNDNTA